jgi:hypothetical protein
MKVMHAVGIIDMTGAQKMRWTPEDARVTAHALDSAQPAMGGE